MACATNIDCLGLTRFFIVLVSVTQAAERGGHSSLRLMPAKAQAQLKRSIFVCVHGRSTQRPVRGGSRAAGNFEPSLAPVQKPTVRVRLSVPFRVPKRQMLCVGGDKLPFGWSFMSIAHVPMTWNPGDIWTVEVCFVCRPLTLALKSVAAASGISDVACE